MMSLICTLQYSYTPLLWACERGRHEALKILLQNGADPNAESVRTQHSRAIQMVHTNDIVMACTSVRVNAYNL